MRLLYLHEFVAEFRSLDKQPQTQIWKKLEELARTELHSYQHLALRGPQFKGLYKFRVGDYRLIYKLDDEALVFVTLGHRSDVYE